MVAAGIGTMFQLKLETRISCFYACASEKKKEVSMCAHRRFENTFLIGQTCQAELNSRKNSILL